MLVFDVKKTKQNGRNILFIAKVWRDKRFLRSYLDYADCVGRLNGTTGLSIYGASRVKSAARKEHTVGI